VGAVDGSHRLEVAAFDTRRPRSDARLDFSVADRQVQQRER
jgi:hypothetical protein